MAGFCVHDGATVSPDPSGTVYPWTRLAVYFNMGYADDYSHIAEAYLRYTFDDSTWNNTSGVLADAGENDGSGNSSCGEGDNWRVKGHIPAPGRNSSSSNFKFTYYGRNSWDPGDWRFEAWAISGYDANTGNVQWDSDGAFHDPSTQVDGKSYYYVTRQGEDATTTSFYDDEVAVLRARAFKEDVSVLTLRHTGNWSGTAMTYLSGADHDNETDFDDSYTVEFWEGALSGDDWSTAIDSYGGTLSYNIKYTDNGSPNDEDYLKSGGMADGAGDGTDFTITVQDDDTTAPQFVKESGTVDTYGPMRILLDTDDLRERGNGLGTKEFDVTDNDLASLSSDNKLIFKFAAYDAESGLQRSRTGGSSTNMSYDIGTMAGFLQDLNGTYVASSSSAGTNSATAKWSVFEHTNAFQKAEITQLYTNMLQGSQGKNKIRCSIYDADHDRTGDARYDEDDQMGYLNVLDQDSAAPTIVKIGSPEESAKRYLHASLGGTVLSSSGPANTNKIYTITDSELAGVNGSGNELKLYFGAIDAGSGLARSAGGSADTDMNIDIGPVITDNYAQYDSGLSTDFEGTKSGKATNAWKFIDFTDSQIENLLTNAVGGVGTNLVAASLIDTDDDRDDDRSILTNQQYGFLVVSDDDPDAPTLEGMRVDYNGSELSNSGSGTNVIYTVTDAQLSDISGKTLAFKFAVWDASGLSRNNVDNFLEDMNYDIGTDYTGDLSELDNINVTYSAGDSAAGTNSGTAEYSVFIHNGNFERPEIAHLVAEDDQGTTGKNAILISAPDNDRDYGTADQAWRANERIGFLQVNDDDPDAPVLANPTWINDKLRMDITDAGSGLGSPIYMEYDDNAFIYGAHNTVGMTNIGGDTYEMLIAVDTNYVPGKTIYYRVFAPDADDEYDGDAAQGVYSNTTLFGLDAPVASAATSTNDTSFTASWAAVTGADDGYRLDVSVSAVFEGPIDTDFEDEDLSGWTQSTADRFAATNDGAISGSISLHHVYDGSAGKDQISYSTDGLDVTAAPTTWQFQLKHGNNPSANNCWGVMLLSDAAAAEIHPSGSVHGYAAAVNWGTTSDDLLKIYKVNGGSGTTVLDTGLDWQSTITSSGTAGVEVQRTAAGSWSVKVDTDGGFDNLVAQGGSAVNTDFTNASHFGVYYGYTASGDQKLWIDDISITQPGLYVTGYSNKTVSGTSAAVSGLSAETTYYYRLRAASTDGALSDNSNTITVNTLADQGANAGSMFLFR